MHRKSKPLPCPSLSRAIISEANSNSASCAKGDDWYRARNSAGRAAEKVRVRNAGASGLAPIASHLASCRPSRFLAALYSASQSGGSPRVAKWPLSSIQKRRASGVPAKMAPCASFDEITETRPRGEAATWAARVVATSASSVAVTALRIDRSYQESATIPCCVGQAPVASVAMLEAWNVLARCRQSGKYAPLSKRRLKPPAPNGIPGESR